MLDSNALRNAAPLLALWEQFGLTISLWESAWIELQPILDRLPPLRVIDPRPDRKSAEDTIARHLGLRGSRLPPVRWFSDAASAHAHNVAVSFFGRPAFPTFGAGPDAIAKAWRAANCRWWPQSESLYSEWERKERYEKFEIKSVATLLQLFAAGVFYYWIGSDEIILIERPSLWLHGGHLHRSNGPAVEWPSGESYFFWQGSPVPRWFIMEPEELTLEYIRSEPDARFRHRMMLRVGMDRFSISECWAEWWKCHDIADFAPFVACEADAAFHEVSKRITAHCEAVVNGMTAQEFRNPIIDARRVAEALAQFFEAWDEPQRPIVWFADGRTARDYIEQGYRQRARAAYWPRLPVAEVFDSAWYRGWVDPGIPIRNLRWLQRIEDWQDWSIDVPRPLDCSDPAEIERRVQRVEHWLVAKLGRKCVGDPSEISLMNARSISGSDPAIKRWTSLMDAFAAGLFYYWIGPEEIVCIPRPALWIAHGRLHRDDGAAVEWPTGERYCFWHGALVPDWVIDEPDKITAELICGERNLELRRCMIEKLGRERFMQELRPTLVAEDEFGKLWRVNFGDPDSYTLLEVRNGTPEPDGSSRRYFLSVPPSARSPKEAVAWTYGLRSRQYEIAIRT
jgi:hypothetical protein